MTDFSKRKSLASKANLHILQYSRPIDIVTKEVMFFKQDSASVFSVRDEVCCRSQGEAPFPAEGEGDLNTFTGATTRTQQSNLFLHIHREPACYIYVHWKKPRVSLALLFFVYRAAVVHERNLLEQTRWDRVPSEHAHVCYTPAPQTHKTQKEKSLIHISSFYFIPTYFTMLHNLQQSGIRFLKHVFKHNRIMFSSLRATECFNDNR